MRQHIGPSSEELFYETGISLGFFLGNLFLSRYHRHNAIVERSLEELHIFGFSEVFSVGMISEILSQTYLDLRERVVLLSLQEREQDEVFVRLLRCCLVAQRFFQVDRSFAGDQNRTHWKEVFPSILGGLILLKMGGNCILVLRGNR